jgi:hypothetical protein
MERTPTNEPTIRELQGRAFLRGLDGRALDPAITDVLYDNPFALSEMAARRLTIYKVIVNGRVKDWVEYNELADVLRSDEPHAL